MDLHVEKVYVREIETECRYALTFDQLMNDVNSESSNVNQFFLFAHGFLTHTAQVSKVLWPGRNAKSPQKVRAKYLLENLGLTGDHPLKNRSLRNHLEHFDERLDKWAEQSTHGTYIDKIIGQARITRGGQHLDEREIIRAYDPKRQVFKFRGEEFNLQDFREGLGDTLSSCNQRMRAILKEQVSKSG